MPIDRSARDSRSKPITINGRFLTQPVSGVQRFAREIVDAWDDILDMRPEAEHREIELVHPPGALDVPTLRHIAIRQVGRLTGHAWEQLELPRQARSRRLIGLANAGPVSHSDSLVVIHDAAVFDVPDSFSWRYRIAHRALDRLLARRARIATVSHFSADRLASHLAIDRAAIAIIPNGVDTMANEPADVTILDRLGLGGKPYFLTFGSGNPRKNIGLIYRAFALLDRQDVRLIIVGGSASGVFTHEDTFTDPRIIAAGQCSDGEIAALYDHACALVSPSRYEGFGLPPLEALVRGCPAIVSDIPPHREACGDAATYIAVDNAPALAAELRRAVDMSGSAPRPARILSFNWHDSARLLAALT
jgi:glycosyltransferase involved in cell wall biosynthesis